MKKLLTIATAFFFSACIGVSAIESTYAYRDTGSISIELEQGEEGTSVSNVEFELIKVADINDGLYEFTEEMETEDIDLNKIETSEELQETAIVLSTQADEKKIEGIKEKTDEKGFLKFDDLDVAIYLLRPSDYAKYEYVQPTLIAVPTYEEGVQNSMEFDITVIPKHTPFKVEISKRDITTSEELEGAHLQVKDADGNIIDEWISGKEPHMIKNLYCGHDYILTETIAPEGYSIAQSINFTVEETGEVQKVTMYDELLPKKVKTGDDMTITGYALLAGGAAIIGLGTVYNRRRKAR